MALVSMDDRFLRDGRYIIHGPPPLVPDLALIRGTIAPPVEKTLDLRDI
jgi:hypothetical protein